MKNLLLILFLSISITSVYGQTRRMIKNWVGRTYSVQNLSNTNIKLIQQAERELRNFDLQKALLTAESAVNLNINSPEALILRAKIKKRMGMETEAKEDVRDATRLNPYIADLYGYNGNASLLNLIAMTPERAMEYLSSAQKLGYYHELLDKKASSKKLTDKEIELLETAITEIETNRLQEAFNTVNEIIQSYPKSAIAFDLKGVIAVRQENYALAIQSFSKAVALEPDFAISWYNFGQLEHFLGNFENAKIYLDRAIGLQEDLTKAYFERALLFKAMGDKQSALEDYDQLLEISKDSYLKAYINRGVTKQLMGDYSGAFADFSSAIEEFPDNPQLYEKRANIYLLWGSPQRAFEDYNTAIQLDPDFATVYYNRALAHLLIYDRISGCYDMDKSEYLGYEKATEMLLYFCTE